MNAEKKKSSNSLIGLFIFILILIVLFATNPKMDDFETYIEDEIIEQTDERGPIVDFLSQLIASPTAWAMSKVTERKNFYLFSIYSIDSPDKQLVYIGLLNHFIPLN